MLGRGQQYGSEYDAFESRMDTHLARGEHDIGFRAQRSRTGGFTLFLSPPNLAIFSCRPSEHHLWVQDAVVGEQMTFGIYTAGCDMKPKKSQTVVVTVVRTTVWPCVAGLSLLPPSDIAAAMIQAIRRNPPSQK